MIFFDGSEALPASRSMGRRRVSSSLALALALVGTAACAPSVTIADESVDGGEAGDVASGGSGNKGGNGQGGSGATGVPSGGTASLGGGETGGTSGSGADGTGGGVASVYLYDENNHRSDVSFSIPIVDTAPGVDLDVCWTEATSDLACANVDPLRDIDTAAMLRLNLSAQEAAQLLAGSELRQDQLDGYLAYESAHDATCTSLFSLTNFGTPVDFTEEYTEDDDRSYLFTFNRDTTPGAGVVTMIFARPTASSKNTRLDAPPGCGLRTVTTDLTTPVQVPFEGPTIVDWRNVTRDGQGNPFNGSDIDRVSLWFVAGGTPSNLEDLVPELDSLATDSYHAGEFAGGLNIDLAELSNPLDGRPFSSFRTNEAGVWLFGLRCGGCMNPELPHVLAVFEPIEAP